MHLLFASEFRPGFASNDPWLSLLFIQWPIGLAPALFTCLLPDLLRYRRGGLAWVGAATAAVISILLPLQVLSSTWAAWYAAIHPWLFGVFYVYALAGLALCGVGIYDGKRSAIWALLAVICLFGGAATDTVIWFGWASGSPWVPVGFIGFWICLGIGYLRRPADAPFRPDLREAARIMANNRTRRSRSIPLKLLREGDLHMLPILYLFRLSDLGREGIENSGSFLFADHIYRNEPSGRGVMGRWLDAVFLASAACQAFRRRYLRCVEEMRKALVSFPDTSRPFRMLALPCGLPRDLRDFAAALAKDEPHLLQRIEYWGMDVDDELLARAQQFTAMTPILTKRFHRGNALLAETFPQEMFHFAVSTGLNEFLGDEQLDVFYRNIFDHLEAGGRFYTSNTQQERTSEVLLRAFELNTHYRSAAALEQLLRKLPWSLLQLTLDPTGLQTFVLAVK